MLPSIFVPFRRTHTTAYQACDTSGFEKCRDGDSSDMDDDSDDDMYGSDCWTGWESEDEEEGAGVRYGGVYCGVSHNS